MDVLFIILSTEQLQELMESSVKNVVGDQHSVRTEGDILLDAEEAASLIIYEIISLYSLWAGQTHPPIMESSGQIIVFL